jgi:hypothetical protein
MSDLNIFGQESIFNERITAYKGIQTEDIEVTLAKANSILADTIGVTNGISAPEITVDDITSTNTISANQISANIIGADVINANIINVSVVLPGNIECISLSVSGGANVSGVVTCLDLNTTSDVNLKTNITPISDPLEKVMKINGYNFEWISNQRKSLGVIAQELEKVIPELVSDTNPKTVNYNGLIALLIEAVKHQEERISHLENNLINNQKDISV